MKTLSKLLLVTLLSVTLAFGLNNTAQAATVHTVQSGDTMWKIAVKYQVGVSELIEATGGRLAPAGHGIKQWRVELRLDFATRPRLEPALIGAG